MRRSISLLMAACLASFLVASTAAALSQEQCLFFAQGDRVTICHRTGAPGSPYAPLDVNERACAAHADHHANDYVAAGDATCQGGSCLPDGAPSDGTLPCCEGLSSVDGFCRSITTLADAERMDAARLRSQRLLPPGPDQD
jgi:hypothetical protein